MKKRYMIKYKYKKARMSFCFYADDQLGALKQFLYHAERFKLPINRNISLRISILKEENCEDDYYE